MLTFHSIFFFLLSELGLVIFPSTTLDILFHLSNFFAWFYVPLAVIACVQVRLTGKVIRQRSMVTGILAAISMAR